MPKKLIAILEDNTERITAMIRALSKESVDHVVFGNANEMIEWLKENLNRVSLLSLDHDLELPAELRDSGIDVGTGRDVSNFLCQQTPCCSVVIHSSNVTAASDMRVELREAGWTCERVAPSGNLEWIEQTWIKEVRKHRDSCSL